MRPCLKLVELRLVCLVLVAVLLGAGLTGCTRSKVNKDNFDKIKLSMTQEEVQKILGPPTEASGLEIPVFSGTTAKWIQGDTIITVQFINGKVVAKEFSKQPKQ
ncbi:MAG: outer membrane protein assembly factor BamE [Deltaproteobacteria bacterium]|nr:outer membrane protein assembly factor BamE [Deltaproteobacteria bacterium]